MSPTRREFLAAGGVVIAASACAPAVRIASRPKHDLVVRGGTVFDGSGAPGVDGDVAISGGVVTQVGGAIAGRG